jgi:hypothetical protein
MKNLKYHFEYFCSPIWLLEENVDNPIYQNINIENLPISTYLKNEIDDLQDIYQSTYNDAYPPEPIGLSNDVDLIFTNRVLCSFELLAHELSKKYNLAFDKSYWDYRLLRLKDSNSNG